MLDVQLNEVDSAVVLKSLLVLMLYDRFINRECTGSCHSALKFGLISTYF